MVWSFKGPLKLGRAILGSSGPPWFSFDTIGVMAFQKNCILSGPEFQEFLVNLSRSKTTHSI